MVTFHPSSTDAVDGVVPDAPVAIGNLRAGEPRAGGGSPPSTSCERVHSAGHALPMLRGGLGRLGHVDVELPLEDAMGVRSELKGFMSNFHGAAKGSAVVVEGGLPDGRPLLLAASDFGTLWALTLSAEVIWSYGTLTSAQGVHATPAVDNGRVFVGDYSGVMHALELHSGALIWRRDLGETIGASAVVFEERVYVMVEFGRQRRFWDGRLYALCARTGHILWQSTPTFGGQPHSSPAIDPARRLVCAGANSGVCRCYAIPPRGVPAASHEMRWEFKTPKMPHAFKSGGRDLYEASIKGPITIWRFPGVDGTRCASDAP